MSAEPRRVACKRRVGPGAFGFLVLAFRTALCCLRSQIEGSKPTGHCMTLAPLSYTHVAVSGKLVCFRSLQVVSYTSLDFLLVAKERLGRF